MKAEKRGISFLQRSDILEVVEDLELIDTSVLCSKNGIVLFSVSSRFSLAVNSKRVSVSATLYLCLLQTDNNVTRIFYITSGARALQAVSKNDTVVSNVSLNISTTNSKTPIELRVLVHNATLIGANSFRTSINRDIYAQMRSCWNTYS